MASDESDPPKSDPLFLLSEALCLTTSTGSKSFFEVQVVMGVKYIEMRKSDRSMETLLLDSKVKEKGTRPLARTSVIETLTELRDSRTASQLGASIDALKRCKSKRTGAGRDLEAQLAAISGDPTVIQAPQIGPVAASTLKVLHRQPGKPLQVEISKETLTYLRNACRHQIDEGAIHNLSHREKIPEERRFHTDTPGISKLYAKSGSSSGDKLRVKRSVTDGSQKYKILRESAPDAAQRARSFFDTGVDVEGHCDHENELLPSASPETDDVSASSMVLGESKDGHASDDCKSEHGGNEPATEADLAT